MEQLGQWGWLVAAGVLGLIGWLGRRAFYSVLDAIQRTETGVNELKQDVKEMRELSGDHAVKIGVNTEAIRTIRDEIAGMRQRSNHG